MKRVVFLLSVLIFALAAGAQDQTVRATVHTAETGDPISKRIYGLFIEHIAGIINTGIWAEMLEDRKFYHPIRRNNAADDVGDFFS
jgi:alpha-N-arabinofuranosidase